MYFNIKPSQLEATLCDSDYAVAVDQIRTLSLQGAKYIRVDARTDEYGVPVLHRIKGSSSPGRVMYSQPVEEFLGEQEFPVADCSEYF